MLRPMKSTVAQASTSPQTPAAHETPRARMAMVAIAEAMLSAAARAQEPTTYTLAFWRSLATLPERGVTPDHAARVLALWQELSTWHPVEPHIDITPEGAVQFGWNDRIDALTVGMYPDGRLDWWALDRRTDEAAGSDDSLDAELPDAFWSFLQRFRRP